MKKYNISYRIQGIVTLLNYPNKVIPIINYWIGLDPMHDHVFYPRANQSDILYMDIISSVYKDGI